MNLASHSNTNSKRCRTESTLKRNIEWLIDYDHTVYHREALNERMDTTGEWIFSLPEFIAWKQEEGRTLWVCGSGSIIDEYIMA